MATSDATPPTAGTEHESTAPGVGMAHTTVVPENYDPEESDRRRE